MSRFDLFDLVNCDRADVRLARIGGNARVDLRRSEVFRAAEVKGNLDLQGRGRDVELENIAGQVTISGSYSGTLAFKNLAKPLHFESQNTDLKVEALPGELSIDLGGVNARNVIGPMRVVTNTRDVKIEDFSNALDLESEVFKKRSARGIARSLKQSAEQSKRRKSSPFRSAMSMLTFYMNRAGKNLPQSRKNVLNAAKDELRALYGRERKG